MKEIQADITTTHLSHIAHGCNAQGVMGSGVAKAVRAVWPKAYTVYANALKNFADTDFVPLGMDVYARIEGDNPKIIHNLITQQFYGRDGSKFARYIDVVESVEAMVKTFRSAKQFAISRLGCSLGGLKWEIVKELLLEIEERYEVEFWIYHIDVDPDA